MKFLFLFLLIVCASPEWKAQISVSPEKISFGTITRDTDLVVDILVENKGSKADYLLRHSFSHEFEVKVTSMRIEPGENIVIRIRFNPRKTGPFEEIVSLYFASMQKPVLLPIRANVLYADPNGGLACPDFSQLEAECCAQNFFSVEVVDNATGSPLSSATVRIEEEGVTQLRLSTNQEGRVSHEAPIGYYTITGSKEGYQSASVHSYINRQHNKFVLRLTREYEIQVPTEEPDKPATDTADVVYSTALPEDQYKPNRIVFLLDVSGSMGSGDKLDLLKKSLAELSGVLREIDQVAVVSYADEAIILLPPTRGNSREQIVAMIHDLRAGGKTSGLKGFRRAYQLIEKSFDETANNQLIVITDGAFNPEDQAGIEKLVRRSAKKRIQTSIVAIRSNSYATESLGMLSDSGNGSFLRIDSEHEAMSVLIEELRKQSRK